MPIGIKKTKNINKNIDITSGSTFYFSHALAIVLPRYLDLHCDQ